MDISIIKNTKDFLRAEGQNIVLLQDSSEYTFTRSDNSLLISTKGGDEAIVEDFFVLDEGASLPVFVVESGESIEGADFLSGMNPQLDLETAAGPASSTAQGSGSGEYSDAAGDLIGGVDRLGSLGTSQWDLALDTTDLLLSDSSALVSPGSSVTSPSVNPPVNPPVDPPVDLTNLFVRGVMYNDDNSTDSVDVSVFFPNDDGSLARLAGSDINFSGQNSSARYQVEIGLPDGWDKSWVDINYNSTSGRMEFKLTAEGLAEMQRLGGDSKNLLDFIKVEVIDSTDPSSNFGYLVEIVAGNNSAYISKDQDQTDHDGGYPVDGMELIGEFHHGKGQDGSYQITSSNKNDEIIINDKVIGGSEIHASGSSDPDQMADDSNMIFLNKGMEAARGTESNISTAKGTVSISNANGADALYAKDGGSNLIQNLDGKYIGDGRHLAEDGGSNTIEANSIEITGLVKAKNSSGPTTDPDRLRLPAEPETKVTLDGLENGSVKVTGGVESEGKGALVTIKGGDVSIIGDSTAISASKEGVVAVIAPEGKLTVQVTGKDGSFSIADGISAQSAGVNEIRAKNIDIIVKSGDSSSARGIVASEGYSKNNIVSSEKLLVDVSSGSDASGIVMGSGWYSHNDISAGELELNVKSTGGKALGMENIIGKNIVDVDNKATIEVTGKDFAAAFYNVAGSQQELKAGGDLTVKVGATAADGEAFGIYGQADISASSVTMTIKGDLSAIVMDGKGTITANIVTLTAESANGESYAMHASAGKNSIIGNSVTGGVGDLITLNGDIHSSGTGQNSVNTGSGDDTITINGTISGAGAIYIDGGDGYDTLILVADSVDDFVLKYGAWLKSLDSDILKGIENIAFSGITDLSELSSGLKDFFDYAKSAGIHINGELVDGFLASPLAFGAEAEALEESALLPGLHGQSDEDDNSRAGESEDSDSSADYVASLAELDLSDLVRTSDSEDNLELSMGKVYTDEPSSNESIFQNLSESIVDITDITGIVDSNENEQSLDILLGGTEGSSSQELHAEISEEELVATLSLDQAAAETANSPSAFLDVNTDAFGNIDEGSDQDMLIQLDILSNFN